MKSERRHELEKNELADRLASGIESTRSYLPIILGGLGVLLVLAVAWGIYGSYSRSQASLAWTDFYFNLTRAEADAFVDVAEDYPNSPAASWARQIAGDNYLQRGIAALYRDKSEATELIGKAIDAFEEVEQQARQPDLRAKALLGLAQAHESLGEIDQAADYYQQLSKTSAQPGLIAKANARLAFLTSQAGKDFYDWFTKLEPKPDAPITLPSDMQLPPTSPDMQFGPGDLDLEGLMGPAAGTPAGGTPAAGLDESPAEATGESPAADAPPAAGQVPPLELAPPASGESTPPPAADAPEATDAAAESPETATQPAGSDDEGASAP